jgi:hypothetical protein
MSFACSLQSPKFVSRKFCFVFASIGLLIIGSHHQFFVSHLFSHQRLYFASFRNFQSKCFILLRKYFCYASGIFHEQKFIKGTHAERRFLTFVFFVSDSPSFMIFWSKPFRIFMDILGDIQV